MDANRFKSMELNDDLLQSVDSDSLVEGYLDITLPRELASSSSSICLADMDEILPTSTPVLTLAEPKQPRLRGKMLTSTPQLHLKSWLEQTLNREKIPGLDRGNRKRSMEGDMDDIHKLSLPVPTEDASNEDDDNSSVFASISSISCISVASSTKRELSAMFDNYERTYRYKFSRFQRQLLQKEVNNMKSKVSDMKNRDEYLRKRYEAVQKRRRLIDDDEDKENSTENTVPPAKKFQSSPPVTTTKSSENQHYPSSQHPLNPASENPTHRATDIKPIPPPRKKRNKRLQENSSAVLRAHSYNSPSKDQFVASDGVNPTRNALNQVSLDNNISLRRNLLQLKTLQRDNDTHDQPKNICRRAKSFQSPLDLFKVPSKNPAAAVHRTFSYSRPRRPAPAPPLPQNTSSNNNIGLEVENNSADNNSLSIFEISTNDSTMFDSGCASNSNNSTTDSTNSRGNEDRTDKEKHSRKRSLRRSLSGNRIYPIITFDALPCGVEV